MSGQEACQARLECGVGACVRAGGCGTVALWVDGRGGSPTVLSERLPVWRDVLAGRQDDVRSAVQCSTLAAVRQQASSTQASLSHSPTLPPPCPSAARLRALRRLTRPCRRLTRSRMALAPYILASTAIRYRHEGCVVDAWMFARCGQQTVFGLLLPLRCAASAILLACVVCVADHVRAWKGTTPAS